MTKRKPVYSIDGRAYVCAKSVKAGHWLEVDGGFTCLPKGARVKVKVKKDRDSGGLFVDCMVGQHFLDGQEEAGRLIGMYPVRA